MSYKKKLYIMVNYFFQVILNDECVKQRKLHASFKCTSMEIIIMLDFHHFFFHLFFINKQNTDFHSLRAALFNVSLCEFFFLSTIFFLLLPSLGIMQWHNSRYSGEKKKIKMLSKQQNNNN